MAKKRTVHSAQLKARVALEAVREQQTINELARKYSIHSSLVRDWKRRLLEGLPGVFEQPGTARQDEELQRIPQLYEQIGRLQTQLDWLKKKYQAVGE
jgi:transposase-like protein